MADKNENIDKEKLDELKKKRDEQTGIPIENQDKQDDEGQPVDKEKLDELKKKRDEQKGIPIENEHVSSDPNKSPKGDDRDEYVDPHPGYIENYNKKKFHNDKKDKK